MKIARWMIRKEIKFPSRAKLLEFYNSLFSESRKKFFICTSYVWFVDWKTKENELPLRSMIMLAWTFMNIDQKN